MRFGFLTLGELDADAATGKKITPKQRLDEIVAAGILTEELGLDAYSVGEHHHANWVLTAPPVVLAAIGAQTRKLRLFTGVTLIANLDPVRVAEDYGTVDVLSNGRLEMVVAKGLYPHPWPLFGQDESQSRERLNEGVDLLLKIWGEGPVVHWKGSVRPEIKEGSIAPRPLQTPPRIWNGVSSSPQSTDFAADRGLPIILGAHIKTVGTGGEIISYFRERTAVAGHDPERIPVGAGSTLYVRKNGKQARREFEQYFQGGTRFSLENRGMPFKPADFEERCNNGTTLCGEPQELIERLLEMHEVFDHDFHIFQADLAGQPWDQVRETMELFATEVAPAVRSAIDRRKSSMSKAAV